MDYFSRENFVVDNTFDRATMGFGLRNITDRLGSLKEIFRILKPGGRFICLEFSHVTTIYLKICTISGLLTLCLD